MNHNQNEILFHSGSDIPLDLFKNDELFFKFLYAKNMFKSDFYKEFTDNLDYPLFHKDIFFLVKRIAPFFSEKRKVFNIQSKDDYFFNSDFDYDGFNNVNDNQNQDDDNDDDDNDDANDDKFKANFYNDSAIFTDNYDSVDFNDDLEEKEDDFDYDFDFFKDVEDFRDEDFNFEDSNTGFDFFPDNLDFARVVSDKNAKKALKASSFKGISDNVVVNFTPDLGDMQPFIILLNNFVKNFKLEQFFNEDITFFLSSDVDTALKKLDLFLDNYSFADKSPSTLLV